MGKTWTFLISTLVVATSYMLEMSNGFPVLSRRLCLNKYKNGTDLPNSMKSSSQEGGNSTSVPPVAPVLETKDVVEAIFLVFIVVLVLTFIFVVLFGTLCCLLKYSLFGAGISDESASSEFSRSATASPCQYYDPPPSYSEITLYGCDCTCKHPHDERTDCSCTCNDQWMLEPPPPPYSPDLLVKE